MQSILEKYADLLVNYCVELQEGQKLLVRATTVAEPLVREVFRAATEVGGIVEIIFNFREQQKILLEKGRDLQLKYISPLHREAIHNFDAYIYIRAPFNLREENNLDAQKVKTRQEAFKEINKVYSERTASRSLKRNLCQFPTLANAQEAGMSLEDYEKFVFRACKLYDKNPIESWLEVRKEQQQIVDFLDRRSTFTFKRDQTNITFSTKGRTWINSDGQTNMPSGEVYTSPVEDSVNGKIHFSLPALYGGRTVEDVVLWVEEGQIVKWEATRGKEVLDAVFNIKGARTFGEAAIGTNYNITRQTNNILFDEKIGGTVHMAIGQSYLQAGGKNHSSIHWDMITEMQHGGTIWADGEKIYENGKFLFL